MRTALSFHSVSGKSTSLLAALSFGLSLTTAARAQTPTFSPGNLVVVVEGCGVQGGTCTAVPNGTGTGTGNSSNGGYGDNQAAPLTLFQYAPTGTSSASYVNSLVLPQTASGANLPVSGEYGSSSEGTLQLSTAGQYLTIGLYGINAATFDASPATYGASPSLALAQSGSLTGQSYTPIPRVIALVDAYGNTNTSSALFNIYSTNNPRSVYTADGVNAYISGQGSGTDATGGVFLTPLFKTNNAPTAITGLDTSANTYSQDTRDVQIVNGTLYISVDTKGGSNNTRDYIGTLGTPPATSLYNNNAGPTQVVFYNNASTPVAVTSNGKLTLTASETNGINASGQQINLSASNYFFANLYTLYVADTGAPKQTSATSTLGDGGLQKWINTKADGTGNWQLMYTLSAGLSLVANSGTTGATGLYALTGKVSGSNVLLYATNYNLSDLDTTYLYGFTDVLAATTKPAGSFTLLATAPSDSNFKGLAFAPTLPTGSATLTSTPSGLTVSTAGTGCAPGNYVTPVTLIWTPGSTCKLTTTTPQTSGALHYVFSQWTDGTTSTTDTVTAPSASASFNASFTNTYQPVGILEKAQDNTTNSTTVQQSDNLLVSGWAADPVDGSPLGNVGVYLDGTFFASPTLGIARPDVAAAYNSTYANSGYQLLTSASAIAVGPHAITVIAVDSTGRSTTFGPLSINIIAQAGPATAFIVSGVSNESQPSVAQTATVTAVDSNGNTVTTFTGTVSLASTDPAATLPAAYSFTASDAGTHTFPLTLNTGGTFAVTATSGSLTGSESGILIADSIWILNTSDSLVRLSDAGTQTTSANTASGHSSAGVLAFDNTGDIWATQRDTNGVVKLSPAGTQLLSTTNTGGLNAPSALFVDGLGQVWLANQGNNSVTVLNAAGTAISPANGYQPAALSTPTSLLVDSSGSVWIANGATSTVTKIIGAAAPVATPIVTGTTNNTLAVRP